MELYDKLSLFNGELLDSFQLFGDSSVLEGLDHGLKPVITLEDVPSKDTYGSLIPDGGRTEKVQEINVPWMDEQMDLVDFLVNEDDIISPGNTVPLFITPDVKSTAQEMLLSLQLPMEDQQVTSVTNSSFTSTDSGVELSLDESTSSLLELLPPQLIQNMEETSALSLLMDGAEVLLDEADISSVNTDLLSMSPDDIEQVLSSPSSPIAEVSSVSPTTTTPSTSTVDLADLFLNVASPAPSITSSVSSGYSGRSSPYAREDSDDNYKTASPVVKSSSGRTLVEKKRRKMQQNKDAAIRYRQKKKNENKSIGEECSVLEDRNNQLRDQIDTMSREIAYLKELMADVATAKSFMKAS